MNPFLAFLLGPIGRYLAIVVIAASTGFGTAWHWQGKRLDAEKERYAQFQASVKAAEAVHAEQDKAKELATTNVIQQKEAENVKTAKVVSDAWLAYSNGLRRAADNRSIGKGQESTQTTSVSACNDDAGNATVLAAVQEYQRSVRQAVDGFRLEAAKELEQCEKQTLMLITLRSEVQEVERVNQ